MQVSFFVPGIPKPGGSKRAFVVKGRAIITEANANSKDWRTSVAQVATEAMRRHANGLFAGPLEVRFDFYMPRLKGHFTTSKRDKVNTLKASAPIYHETRPDTTKLIRSTEDAMKGIVWVDDSQVAKQTAIKRYGSTPGAQITVCNLMSWDDL